MPITVAQLAADAQLGLTVLSGHVGLRHEISWAHTSELLDPTQCLEVDGTYAHGYFGT